MTVNARESFRIEGPGCWCPDSMTLTQARHMGHTRECSEAREGWRQNMRGLSEMAREKREMEAIGRAYVERERAASSGATQGTGTGETP